MNKQVKQIWKIIEDNPRYEVSNYGEVRHIKRKRVIKPRLTIWGYYRVCLSNSGLKNGKLWALHRLVAKAFVPNHNNLPQVNHKDGNKLNNCADNLEWVTPKQNIAHAKENGLIKDSDFWRKTTLHKEAFVEICGLYNLGFTYEEIGNKFNTHKSTISNFIYSKRWLNYYPENDFNNAVSLFIKNNKGEQPKKKWESCGGNKKTAIIQIDKEGNVVGSYSSITEAAIANNVLKTSITNNLKNRSKFCGGYRYEYQ